MTEELPTSVAICSSLRQLQQFERVNLGTTRCGSQIVGKISCHSQSVQGLMLSDAKTFSYLAVEQSQTR